MEAKKYYITASGTWGDFMVSYDNEPTWNLDSAMTFDTELEASEWIGQHGKEWIDYELTICVCEFDN